MHWLRRHRGPGRPPHPDVLTPAEWRVLEHVRKGLPNAEIAVRLGVSVNTVRTHVSSMLAKLEVPDRQALAAWRGEPAEASTRALVRRAFGSRALEWLRGPAASLARIAGVGGLALAGALVVWYGATVASGSGGGGGAPGTPTPMPTEVVEATPTAEAEVTPRAEVTPGLFTDRRPTQVSRTISLPAPQSPFPPYDRESLPVRVYDFTTGEQHDLGPGHAPPPTSP